MTCLRLFPCIAMLLFAGQCVFAAEPEFYRQGGGFIVRLPVGADYADAPQVKVSAGRQDYPEGRVIVTPGISSGAKSYGVVIKPKTEGGTLEAIPYSVKVYYKLNDTVLEFSRSVTFDSQTSLANLPKLNSSAGNVFPGAPKDPAAEISAPERKALLNGLVESIIDLARKARVPGVAYYDHEPRLSCRTLAGIFEKARGLLDDMPEVISPEDDAKLVGFLKDEFGEFYESRDRLADDWKPYLENVQEMIRARQNSNDKRIGVDLTSRADVDLVFRALQAAFLQMEKMHRDYAPDFYSPELIRQFESGSYGGNVSRGGQYGTTGSGSAACPHCRKGHRHCRCARLLFR